MIKSYINRITVATTLIAGVTYAADPMFHLKNNSADAIQIDIMQNNKSLTGLKRVAKGGEFEFMLDISKPTTVDINYCPTATYCKTNLPDKMIAKFKAGKTIYVKFDGKKVQPQKGNTLTGKTTSGYSSKNNVEKSDISVQEAKTSKSELGVGGMYKQETSQPAKPTAQPAPSANSEQSIEDQAWKYFSQGARAKKRFGWDSDDLSFEVLDMDIAYFTGYDFRRSSDEKIQRIHNAYDKKSTELKKIVDVKVRDKALEIAKTARDNAIKYVEKRRQTSEEKPTKPAKPSAPKPTTPANYQEAPAQEDPLELAWKHFPAANNYRLDEQVDFFNSNTDLAQVAHVSRKILNVEKNVSNAQIAKAFRVLSLKYHPDKSPIDKKDEYSAVQNILSRAKDALVEYNEKK